MNSQTNKTPSRGLVKKGLTATKYTLLFRTTAQVVGAASTIFLVRALSERDYGIYNLLYSVIALLGMVFSFGIANVLQRYMPEYYNRGEFVLAHRLFRTASLVRLISNVIILGLILFLWENVAPLLKITDYKNYFLLFSVVILLHLQRGILESCLASYFLQKHTQRLAIAFVLIKGIGYGAALFLSWNLWYILCIDLLAYILVFGLLQVVYNKMVPCKGGTFSTFNVGERKRILRYSLFYNFNDVGVGMLDANFDNFIIALYLDPLAVGAYAFCQRITKMAERVLPVNYLLDVIRPLFFTASSLEQQAQVKLNCQLLLKLTYLFQIPLFCFFLLYSKDIIIILFGGKFIDYYPIVIAVSFFSLLNAFQQPVGLVAQLRERADIILYSKVFALYNLAADVVLIRYFGIWGAVVATGTATFGRTMFVWWFVRKEVSLGETAPFFYRMIVCWGVVVIVGCGEKYLALPILFSLALGCLLIVAGFWWQLRYIHFTTAELCSINHLATESKKIKTVMKWCGIKGTIVNGG